MNTDLHFSSATDDWATPQDTFDALNAEFRLNLDVAADKKNAKLPRFFTKENDGLAQSWAGARVWCNPPYGRVIGKWVAKCAGGGAEIVVALLPARPDTRYFHDHIYGKAEIRFIKGRLKFGGYDKPAPFPSMVVIWRNPQAIPAIPR